MKWHKVVLNNEQISAGEISKVQEAYIELYRAFNFPKGMALLIDHEPKVKTTDNKTAMETSVYFPPGNLPYAQPLISLYSGEPCEQPQMKDLALLAGDPDAIKSHQ